MFQKNQFGEMNPLFIILNSPIFDIVIIERKRKRSVVNRGLYRSFEHKKAREEAVYLEKN